MEGGVSRLVRLVEELVSIPTYALLGSAGGRIVYLSTKEGVVSLWSLDPASGETARLTEAPVSGAAPTRPESPHVVFTRDVSRGRELHRILYVDAAGGEEKPVSDAPPMRVFALAFDGERVAFTGATAEEMAIYMARLGGGWEKLYSLDTMAFVTDVEGDYIVGYGNLRHDPRTNEIFVYRISTGEMEVYTPRDGSNNKAPRLSGGRVLFESNFEGRSRLYVYDPDSGVLERAGFSHGDYDAYDPVEHDAYGWHEGIVWAVAKKEGRSRLFLDGREVPTPRGTIHGVPAFLHGRIYVAVSNISEPPRIYEASPGSGEPRVVVDNRLPEWIAERLQRAWFARYRSFDGLWIPVYVVEGSSERPGPGVVYVHGGPWSEVRDMWSVMLASIAAAGFNVVAPNFRGSTGYGDEFRTMDIGDPGGRDLGDVVEARRWGIEQGILDPSRVAVMGYSYGGYMTLLAMGRHPNLWRCGVAGASVADWEEMYGMSDAIFKKFIEVLFAGRRELWRERSPSTYADKVSAPLCLIHPQNDTRTPLKPVLRYMEKLLDHGKVFEAHIVPDMGHVLTTMEEAVKILLPALIFLDKHLRAGAEPSTPPAP